MRQWFKNVQKRYSHVFDRQEMPEWMAKAEHEQYLDMAELEFPHITRLGLRLDCRIQSVKNWFEDWAYVLFARPTHYMTPCESWDPYYGGM